MRYITRTITSVIAICKVYNNTTDSIEDATFNIGNVPEAKVEKEINKMLKDTDLKLIKVVECTTEEAKYKMSEAQFIANAEVVE